MRNCDSCGTELIVVFPETPKRRNDDYINYNDSLHIHMTGGYGEYVDSIFGPHDDIIICKKCADVLMKENPWLASIVNPPIPEGVAKPRG